MLSATSQVEMSILQMSGPGQVTSPGTHMSCDTFSETGPLSNLSTKAHQPRKLIFQRESCQMALQPFTKALALCSQDL